MTFVLATGTLAAHEHEKGKSCDMKKAGETISLSGTVSCKDDDCAFKTADEKTTYSICEMSKVDLPKLSESGKSVAVKGKLITCEGKEKLVIESAE